MGLNKNVETPDVNNNSNNVQRTRLHAEHRKGQAKPRCPMAISIEATKAPRAPTINLSQLRTLSYIASRRYSDRQDLLFLDDSKYSSTEKRLAYLHRHELILVTPGELYHDRFEFDISDRGSYLIAAWLNDRTITDFTQDLTRCLEFSFDVRDSPINTAQLQILDQFCHRGALSIKCFLSQLQLPRQTARSRLRYLVKSGYIARMESFNRGGNTHPNHYAATPMGKSLCKFALGNI